LRIDRAWQAWDDWCIATRNARWRTDKHAAIPDKDRQVAEDLERALQVGAVRLGVTATDLRTRIEAERRGGWTVPEAVSRTVEHLLGRQRGDHGEEDDRSLRAADSTADGDGGPGGPRRS
jgi:hypothetical protein